MSDTFEFDARWFGRIRTVEIGIHNYEPHPSAGTYAYGKETEKAETALGPVRIVHLRGNHTGLRGDEPAPVEEWTASVEYPDVLDPGDGPIPSLCGEGLSLQAALNALTAKVAEAEDWLDRIRYLDEG